MKTYKFIVETDKTMVFQSKKYRVSVNKSQGHIYVVVKGPNFKRQGLSNIHSNVNNFELKVIALYFASKARMYGKNIPYRCFYYNYANIFGSCFE